MGFAIAIAALLILSAAWLSVRAGANKRYAKGQLQNRRAPDAPDAEFAAQMEVRLEYYRLTRKHPPEVRRIGETIVCADDFDAARPILGEYERLLLEHPPAKPLGALAILQTFDYRSVWFLDGLSDIVKSAIYDQSRGHSMYLAEYGVIVAIAGDRAGFLRAYGAYAAHSNS
jgi:hypothetical protein